MDLVNCSLVQVHVSVVAALHRDKVTRLDNARLRKVFELDVLILQVEVG